MSSYLGLAQKNWALDIHNDSKTLYEIQEDFEILGEWISPSLWAPHLNQGYMIYVY